MIPNRFPDEGQAPEYNTVDATLGYFEAIRAYRDAALRPKQLFTAALPYSLLPTEPQKAVQPCDGGDGASLAEEGGLSRHFRNTGATQG